jgi:transposase
MADSNVQAVLFGPEPGDADAIFINDRCVLRIEGDQRIVVVAGVPLAHFVVGDRLAEAYAMVSLVEPGWADQNDVARAFGRAPRTLRRYQRRYDEGGLVRLGRAPGYPKGRPRGPSRDRAVGKLKAAGLSNRAIAHRLGLDEKSVRKRLRRLGWTPRHPEQLPLPGPALPAPSADPNLSAVPTGAVEPPSPRGESAADPNLSALSVGADSPAPATPASAGATRAASPALAGAEREPVSPSLDRDRPTAASIASWRIWGSITQRPVKCICARLLPPLPSPSRICCLDEGRRDDLAGLGTGEGDAARQNCLNTGGKLP